MGNLKDIDPTELARMLQQTGGEVKEFIQKQKEITTELHARILELEQKNSPRPSAPSSATDDLQLCGLILDSEGVKSFLAGNTQSCKIDVPSKMLTKTQIINATGQNQPLVPADRDTSHVAFAPQQRLTIRGLFSQVPTNSNAIEFTRELTFTNNAAPQGGSVSPIGNGEGELKNESAMTFSLQNVPVATIAHWIPASRQVLGDSPLLSGHISSRLLYGLALEEERELLLGTGAAGQLNGLITQATAFTGGQSNLTALDLLARAANQLSIANYEPSGFILHPTDWLNMKLLKTTTGEYIMGDPQSAAAPMLWGLPVVPTPSMTQGKFVCVDARRAGYIADRENAAIRISENVNDHFIRNMVAILAEERCALVIENTGGIIYGDVTVSS